MSAPAELVIEVTAADIRLGERTDVCRCPIAVHVHRATGGHAMSHYQPMHARDGQRRDAWRALARDTWTLIRVAWIALPLITRRALARAAGIIPAPRPVRAGTAQAPRPVDPPREMARGDEVRAGATPATPAPGAAPGQARDAGDAPSPAAAATAPGGAAQLPRPVPGPPGAGPGQHLPWVITQPPPGAPLPAYRGDYRPTEPFRAVGDLQPVNIFRPHYERHEARRDSTARWGA